MGISGKPFGVSVHRERGICLCEVRFCSFRRRRIKQPSSKISNPSFGTSAKKTSIPNEQRHTFEINSFDSVKKMEEMSYSK